MKRLKIGKGAMVSITIRGETTSVSLRELNYAPEVVRTCWRLGYGKADALAGYGWRRVFWRIWWCDRARERELLERAALNVNVLPAEGESTASFRERIAAAHRRGPAE